MSNLSVLQQNILLALDDEVASTAFLRACDRTSVLDAERYALEVRDLVRFVQPALFSAAAGLDLAQPPAGLLDFILERHRNWRFPPKGQRHEVRP